MRVLIIMVIALHTLSAQQADIKYDEQGIAHIAASSAEGVAYGVGRMQMQDFPVLTAFLICAATGHLSETLGEGPNVYVINPGSSAYTANVGSWLYKDYEMLTWDIPGLAAAQANTLDSAVSSVLSAFVLGLNDGRISWFSGNDPVSGTLNASLPGASWPLQFNATLTDRLLRREITTSDVLCRAAAAASASSRFFAYRCIQLGVCEPITGASNVWIVSKAARDASHQFPVLLSDPHPLMEAGGEGYDDLRPIFYTMAFTGAWRAGGWGIPGLLGMVMGYNDDIAWGYTSNSPDNVDMWEANYTAGTSGGEDYFAVGSTNAHIGRSVATLPVYNAATNTTSNRSILLSRVYINSSGVHYPVLWEDTSTHHIKWGGMGTSASGQSIFDLFYRLSTASGITAADSVLTSPANGVCALADGHLLMISRYSDMRYWYLGHVPVRDPSQPRGYYRSSYLDGTVANNWWTESGSQIVLHPLTDLPHETAAGSSAPSEVWSACNSHPASVLPGGMWSSSVDSAHPEWKYAVLDGFAFRADNCGAPGVGTWVNAPSLRQQRVRTLLGNSNITLSMIEAAAKDVHDNWIEKYAPYFKASLSRLATLHSSTYSTYADVYNAVTDAFLNVGSYAWDGTAARDSEQAALAWLLRTAHDYWIINNPTCHDFLFRGIRDWEMPSAEDMTNTSSSNYTPYFAADIDNCANALWDAIEVRYAYCINDSVLPGLSDQGIPPWGTSSEASLDHFDSWFRTSNPPAPLGNPFSSIGGSGLSLGEIKFLWPAPTPNPLDSGNPLNRLAIYPTSGVYDSLFCNYDAPGRAYENQFNLAPVIAVEAVCSQPGSASAGSRSLLLVEFKPSTESGPVEPVARYIQAIGNSEFSLSPRRYKPCANYASRTLETLLWGSTGGPATQTVAH